MPDVPSATQPIVLCDQRMQQPMLVRIGGGQVALFSSRCPAKTTANEDVVALIPHGDRSAVLVVADGLGGPAAGDRAALLAAEALVQAVEEARAQGQLLRSGILNGFERANQAVRQMGLGAATTLVVVEIEDGQVRPYHAGDSIVMVVGNHGKIKLQTVSHSPVGYAVEAGVLEEAEAMHHKDRHLVSNVLGMPEMRIEIGSALRLAPRDTLLLASDGLADNLRADEIVQRIRKGPLRKAARRLATDATQLMTCPQPGQPSKPDDLTFVLFRPSAKKPGPKTSEQA